MANDNEIMTLNDEELEQVSGGANTTKGGCVFSHHIGQYDGVIGQRYFITRDAGSDWFMGVLLESYEEPFAAFFTKRKHKFSLMLKNGNPYLKTDYFYGENVSLYLYCDKYD